MAHGMEKRLGDPDEVRTFPFGRLDLYSIGGIVIGRTQFDPGWHWAEHVKPIVATHSCQIHHMGIVLSGHLGVRMDDGTEFEIHADTAYDIPSGHDGWVIGDEPWITIDFMGMENFAEPSDDDRVLMSILFTDIVGSTALASRLGDVAWRELLARYNRETRMALERSRVRAVRDTGDGVLALFDSAARAVNCALSIVDLARAHGIEIRAGIHTGEVTITDDEVRGVAVHEAERVMALAGAGEVLVSAATRALFTSGALRFESRGTHELKGIQGDRELFAAERVS
jgi:class 3 adenylate cyclase